MKRSGTQGGFTLIEVLVALALMAMIATILIILMQIGGHTWQRVTRATAQRDDIAQTQDFLRQRLSTLYPYAGRSGGAQPPAFLVADGSSLEFTSDAPEALATGMMRYRLLVDRSSADLAIQWRLNLDSQVPNSTQWVTERLLRHVESLTVQFWQPANQSPGRWVDRWDDLTHIPPLIRIEVALAANDARRWPPLYIEPRVTTAVTCEFDVVSRQCRAGS